MQLHSAPHVLCSCSAQTLGCSSHAACVWPPATQAPHMSVSYAVSTPYWELGTLKMLTSAFMTSHSCCMRAVACCCSASSR